jgi:hypothetical protein
MHSGYISSIIRGRRKANHDMYLPDSCYVHEIGSCDPVGAFTASTNTGFRMAMKVYYHPTGFQSIVTNTEYRYLELGNLRDPHCISAELGQSFLDVSRLIKAPCFLPRELPALSTKTRYEQRQYEARPGQCMSAVCSSASPPLR